MNGRCFAAPTGPRHCRRATGRVTSGHDSPRATRLCRFEIKPHAAAAACGRGMNGVTAGPAWHCRAGDPLNIDGIASVTNLAPAIAMPLLACCCRVGVGDWCSVRACPPCHGELFCLPAPASVLLAASASPITLYAFDFILRKCVVNRICQFYWTLTADSRRHDPPFSCVGFSQLYTRSPLQYQGPGVFFSTKLVPMNKIG